jgi:hypothetical protein
LRVVVGDIDGRPRGGGRERDGPRGGERDRGRPRGGCRWEGILEPLPTPPTVIGILQ